MQNSPHILIIDDDPSVLLILESILENGYQVHAFDNGHHLLDYVARGEPCDLVLTDAVMPTLSGFDICQRIKSNPLSRDIPVLFLSGLESDTDEAYGLSIGAEDFIHKPFSPPVVLARVGTHIALARANRHLQVRNEELERLAEARAQELVRRGEQIMAAQEATISALCTLVEVRDNETGHHILRTQNYVQALARELQRHPRFAPALSDEAIHMIFKTAPLHDIGKVAIPDSILLKPGKLSAEEWVIMKRHCEYGRDALAKASVDIEGSVGLYLRYAKEIAYCHHERWDGSGYPQGLMREDIPISARLMALADVYDALTSRRVYKPPFTHAEALDIIYAERGKHFDPDVIDALCTLSGVFQQISQRYTDDD